MTVRTSSRNVPRARLFMPGLLLTGLLLAGCQDKAEAPTAADATMQQGIEASVEDVTAAQAAMRGPAPVTEETEAP